MATSGAGKPAPGEVLKAIKSRAMKKSVLKYVWGIRPIQSSHWKNPERTGNTRNTKVLNPPIGRECVRN
jgi:hypothetical protein